MDADRFDTLARALTAVSPRRGVALGLAGLTLSAMFGVRLDLAGAGAKRKKRKKGKKKRGRCSPNCGDRECGDDGCGGLCGACGSGRICQDGSCVDPPPYCTGKNICVDGQQDSVCGDDGTSPCYCFVTAETGEPFCAMSNTVAGSCEGCTEGRRCVDATGEFCYQTPGSTQCALPCIFPY